MKLYAIPTCPFVERVKIYISYQKLSDKVKLETIDLATPPPDLIRANPNATVPTFMFQDGNGFGESLLIVEYLDDSAVGQSKKIFGPSATSKALIKARWSLIENRFFNVIQKTLYTHGSFNAETEAIKALPPAFHFLEDFISHHTEIFFTENLSFFDVALAPFILRFEALRKIKSALPAPPEQSRVRRYFNRLLAHPDIKKSCLNEAALLELVKKFSFPNDALQKVIDAPRTLIDAEEQIVALNTIAIKNEFASVSPWSIQQNENGKNLFTTWTFKTWQAAANALKTIQDICDTTDHHVDLNIKGVTTFEISLCTHKPNWGISEKDLCLAKVLSIVPQAPQFPI